MNFKEKAFYFFVFYFIGAGLIYAASRGTGTFTSTYSFYKPVSREEPGYLTDATSSYNNNTDLIDTQLNNLRIAISTTALTDAPTNFIQTRTTLQSGTTFYVSSGSVYGPLYVGSMTAYGTIYSTSGFVGPGSGLTSLPSAATAYIQNTSSLQSGSTFYVSSGSVDGQTILARTSGNVGIATNGPIQTLDVRGAIAANGTRSVQTLANSIVIGGYAAPVSSGAFITAQGPDTGQRGGFNFIGTLSDGSAPRTQMTIDQSGNVGISTSAPITAFSVVGTITQTNQKGCTLGLTTDAFGSINGCAASDQKLKANILPFEGDTRIDELNPVTYTWKISSTTVAKDHKRHVGFIAQEVEKVYPQAVVSAGQNLNGESMKGVDSNALIAVLVKEIQGLRKRVAALEKK